MLFGAGIWLSNFCRTVSGAAASLLNYIINGKTPDLVADFNGSLNDGTEFYDAGGTVDTFAELITHSRAGNATMTDGYGPELVTNGTFNNSDGWSTGAGWEISNGQANRITGAYSELLYTFPSALQAGKTYTIEFTAPISGVMAIGFIGPIVTSAYATRSGATAITLTATGSHTGLRFLPGGPATDGAIDNVSVREIPAIKWAPHNLLTYSEDFTNAAWTKFGTSSITGTKTINFPAVDDRIYQSWSSVVGDVDTFGAILSGSGTVTIHLASGGINSSTQITLTSTPTLYSVSGTATISATGYVFIRRNAGDTATSVVCDGVTRYRSDLGGMVDNPETGDSYVPTTSSAVYLPRRNHHVYNGDAWVNEGVLHESEARTNLVTYSQDFTDSSWVKANTATLALDSVGPDGQANSAVKLIDSNDSGTGSVIAYINLTLATTTAHTFSCYLKADQLSWGYLRAASYATLPNGGAYFDLSSGTVGTVEDAAYSATIQDVGNGWYRCALSFTTEADGTGRLDIFVAQDDLDPNVARDGTSSILIYGAQVEAGSTPSSLIPTNGATVSKALETLTIPAANMPWPEPNYIGPELVTNGDFSNGTTGWTAQDAILSVVDGELLVTADGTLQRAYQAITVESGKAYLVSGDATNGSGSALLRIGTSIGSSAYALQSGTGNISQVVVASSSSLYITASAGATYDNISVREIDPLSVSIQMNGRVTYADTATSNEAIFAYWKTDSSNFIRLRLRTDGSNTGAIGFDQSFSGTFDFVAQDFYSPSILVPYNIASRHGSTFINGAVDGTALTANTTPTALPDLSSTNFSLAYDYMGTISMLRVWADDLADVGIAEATEPSEVPSLQLTFDNSETSFTIQDWEQ